MVCCILYDTIHKHTFTLPHYICMYMNNVNWFSQFFINNFSQAGISDWGHIFRITHVVFVYCTGYEWLDLQGCVKKWCSGKFGLICTRLTNRNQQMNSNKQCDVCSVDLWLRNTCDVKEIINGNKPNLWMSYYWVGSEGGNCLKWPHNKKYKALQWPDASTKNILRLLALAIM